MQKERIKTRIDRIGTVDAGKISAYDLKTGELKSFIVFNIWQMKGERIAKAKLFGQPETSRLTNARLLKEFEKLCRKQKVERIIPEGGLHPNLDKIVKKRLAQGKLIKDPNKEGFKLLTELPKQEKNLLTPPKNRLTKFMKFLRRRLK